MKLEVKQSTIIAFLLYHAMFINLNYISGYGIFKYLGLIFITIFLALRIKLFLKRNYLKVNILLIIFCTVLSISSIYNRDFYGNRTFLIGIFNALCILDMFWFFEYLSFKKKVKHGIKIFYRLTIFYVIINDIIMLLIPKLFEINHMYFLGNKFEVAYLHILMIILFYQINIDNINRNILIKLKLILIIVLSIFISIKVKCTTALIGCGIIIIFIVFEGLLKRIMLSNKVMLISLAISDSILLLSSSILSSPLISYIIVNILNEDLTLTGRMRIYQDVFSVINERLMLGYGYGNSYFVLIDKIYAPNAQNGILESLLTYGIVGTILMVMLMYISMKNVTRNTNLYPIIIIIYMYIFLSSVEVTIGITILPFFAIINVEDKEK